MQKTESDKLCSFMTAFIRYHTVPCQKGINNGCTVKTWTFKYLYFTAFKARGPVWI